MASVNGLMQQFMNGSHRRLVKGGLFYKYFQSPFFVWCDTFAPKEEKDPDSAYMMMILENGRIHEDVVCEEQFSGGLTLDPTLYEVTFKDALEGMFAGEQFIKNGIFYNLPGRQVAVPDVLVKRPGRSVWGDWHYEVVEIKSSKQIREEHIMQAAYYNYLIGGLQGFTPETFVMIDGQKESSTFQYADYKDKVLKTITDIKNIFAGFEPPVEKLNWPWHDYSLKRLREQKGVGLIPGLPARHRELLEASGIRTLDNFFSLNILSVTGIMPPTLERYRQFAKVFLQGKHMFREKPFLPEGKVEVFLDFEGVDGMRIKGNVLSGDYLIGAVVRGVGEERYVSFVAETMEQEHEMLLSFLKFLKELDGAVIYHYGSYEKSHLAKMFQRYGIDETFSKQVIGSLVDLLQVTRKAVVFPTTSYTLKDIAGYLGFTWKGVASAKDSIVLYMDYVQGNKQALDEIIQYNKDDCLALKRLKDFLVWGT